MKVIGFDSWLGGFRNFKRLHSDFKFHGIDFNLIHLSSWANIPYTEKSYDGLKSTDISTYKTVDFDKILKFERPDLVIFLSTDVFAHKSMIRACKRLNIKTVHLFHGLMSVLSVTEKASYSKSITQKILFALPRVPKFLRYIIPNYFWSVSRDKLTVSELVTFVKTLFKFFNGHNIKTQGPDSRTDRVIVFNANDANYAIDKFGYKLEQVKEVGSPDLHEFNFHEKDVNSYSTQNVKEYVLYLDSVPFLRGIMTRKVNLEYLIKIHQKVKESGKKLVIKLHPEHQKSNFGKILSEQGITLVGKEDFISYLKKTDFVISEATSLFQIPALMGFPIYILNTEDSFKFSYGELITSYPNTFELSDINKVGRLHQKLKVSEHWIKKNCGPKPFKEFNKRVVRELIEW